MYLAAVEQWHLHVVACAASVCYRAYLSLPFRFIVIFFNYIQIIMKLSADMSMILKKDIITAFKSASLTCVIFSAKWSFSLFGHLDMLIVAPKQSHDKKCERYNIEKSYLTNICMGSGQTPLFRLELALGLPRGWYPQTTVYAYHTCCIWNKILTF